MQKIVALVVCLSLIVSTQAFVGGNDGLGGLLMYNMMSGGSLFGNRGGLSQQNPSGSTQGRPGATPNVVQMPQRPQSPFGNIFQLALLTEGGLF